MRFSGHVFGWLDQVGRSTPTLLELKAVKKTFRGPWAGSKTTTEVRWARASALSTGPTTGRDTTPIDHGGDA